MSVTTEKPAGAKAIRPFTIEIPEADVEDLRARIGATRLPEKEPVDDTSQGVQLTAATTSRPGRSRDCSQKRFAPASDRYGR